jgi:ABC-type branched-subunit amino acid transport system ATPase component
LGSFEARELSVRSADAALRGVSLYVTTGELVGLLGDRGGSALVRTLAGVLHPASGVVRVDGEDVTGMPVYAVAQRGILLLPERRGVATAMTVRENVRAGAGVAPGGGARAAVARGERTELVLGWFPPLAALADRPAGTLDATGAGLLALAVAVARGPRLLLVDGLLPSVGAAGYADALAGLRAATGEGMSAIVADVVRVADAAGIDAAGIDPAGTDAAGIDPAGTDAAGIDPAAFDRAFLVGDATLRPWYAATRADPDHGD